MFLTSTFDVKSKKAKAKIDNCNCRQFREEPRRLISVEDRDVVIYVKKKTIWNGMTQQFLEIVIFLTKPHKFTNMYNISISKTA